MGPAVQFVTTVYNSLRPVQRIHMAERHEERTGGREGKGGARLPLTLTGRRWKWKFARGKHESWVSWEIGGDSCYLSPFPSPLPL